MLWNAADDDDHRSGNSMMCIAGKVTTAELIRVVVKFLNDHPTELHEETGIVVYHAFINAYPCEKAKTP